MSIIPPVSSPCIDICDLIPSKGDTPTGLCAGCGRTLDEIAQWGMISEAERLQVMATLLMRIESMGERAAAPEEARAHIKAVLNR